MSDDFPDLTPGWAELPLAFQHRARRHASSNPLWDRHEPYELFVAREAHKLATAARTLDNLKLAKALPMKQLHDSCGIDSAQHTPSSMAATFTLARLAMSGADMSLWHAAMCAVVGCAMTRCPMFLQSAGGEP